MTSAVKPETSSTVDRPELTLVMALYNCVELSKACLASLLATLPEDLRWELLLVDDYSTDDTRAWLATLNDPRIRVLLNEKNLGYAASNNRAVALARAPFLALLNNDLVLTPGWLPPMLDLARNVVDAGVVGNVQYHAGDGVLDHAGVYVTVEGKPEHIRELPRFVRARRRVAAVTGACFVLRTALWQALEGYDTQFFNGAEDIDLCFKASQVGLSNYVATRSRIFHHVSPSPGRKLRDEQNSYRLTLKWHGLLARLGAVSWSRRFLKKHLSLRQAFDAPFEMLHLVFYASGFTRFPPVTAMRGMEVEMKRQLAYWELILGK